MKRSAIFHLLLFSTLCFLFSSCSSAPAASSQSALSHSESVSSIAESISSVPAVSSSNVASDSSSEAELAETVFSQQDLADAHQKFQEVFEQVDAVELYEGQYDGCKRYVLVNDYDGDGSLEAYAFYGIESDAQPFPFWENICLYYIDSDYNVTALAGGTSDYDTYLGSISCPEPYYADDFSNCFYTSGNERYLAWSVTYWEGDWFALILGVHDGKPVLSYPGSVFYINDAGEFATMNDDDQEVLVQLKDGQATPLS